VATTLKQIAAKVGVHPSTISRVLTDRYENFSVSAETRELILKTARQMHYVPNEMARGLRLRKSHTIGIVIPDILNPLYAGIIRSIERANTNDKYYFIICNTDEDQEKEIKLVEMLVNKRMDGLLIVPVQEKLDHLKALREQNYPMVFILRCFDEMESNAVVMENSADAFRAVEHLIKLGHRRIGFIRGRRNSYEIQGREQGYRAALQAHQLAIDPALIVGDGCLARDGYQATQQILGLANPPSALLVSENVIVVGVLESLFEAGLMIPDDFSIISFADMTFAPYFPTPLTTISMPIEQIGKHSIQILLKQMNSPEKPLNKKISLPGKFIIRKSTHKPFGS